MIEKGIKLWHLKNYFKYIYLQRITSYKHLGTLEFKQMETGYKSLSNYPVENNIFSTWKPIRENQLFIFYYM